MLSLPPIVVGHGGIVGRHESTAHHSGVHTAIELLTNRAQGFLRGRAFVADAPAARIDTLGSARACRSYSWPQIASTHVTDL